MVNLILSCFKIQKQCMHVECIEGGGRCYAQLPKESPRSTHCSFYSSTFVQFNNLVPVKLKGIFRDFAVNHSISSQGSLGMAAK